MNQLEQTNEPREMMTTSFGENKLDKSMELNDSMTIKETGKDDYSQTLHSLGGNNNG